MQSLFLSLAHLRRAHTHTLSLYLTHPFGRWEKQTLRKESVCNFVSLSFHLFVCVWHWMNVHYVFHRLLNCLGGMQMCICFVNTFLFSLLCLSTDLPLLFLQTFYMKITAVGHIDMRSIFDAHFCKLCLEKLHIFLSKIPADPFLKVYGLLLLCVDLLSRNVYADVWRYVGVNPSLLPKASDRPSRLRRRKRWRKKKYLKRVKHKTSFNFTQKNIKELSFTKVRFFRFDVGT